MKLLNNFMHKHTNKNIVAWFTMPQVYQTACLYTTHAIARTVIFTHYFLGAGDPDHQQTACLFWM